jgi:methionyl-tRNA formyltransferase
VPTVFLGTSDFAAAVLQGLAAAGEAPAIVVSRPDRPRGRGRRLASPPAVQAARRLGVEVQQPADVNSAEALAAIEAARPDVLCLCAYGAIIREPLLSAHPMLNVHPSLLPRWRGAAPIERAIMAGDEQTGVSIMRLGAGLDDGPVCLAGEEPIDPSDAYGTLAPRLEALGTALLVRALREPLECAEQDEQAATYADKITAEDRRLDPARPAVELERVVRALHPHIGAHLEPPHAPGLGVESSRVASESETPAPAPAPAGTLIAAGDRLLLGCTPGTLELLEVKPPGGRAMTAADYLHGHGLPSAPQAPRSAT